MVTHSDFKRGINKQLQQGKGVAWGEVEMRPYADKPYHGKIITTVIETLIEKARQNIKSGQFSKQNTLLVLNLCLIPPFITDNRTLRPAYCDDYMFSKAVTGALWMVAFARPGMLVLGNPEFEGKPCVEGFIEKLGILTDDEYSDVSGLLIVIYPLGGKPCIYGLYRSANYIQWMEHNNDLADIFTKLTEKNWNDDDDSNGWQLDGGA